MRAPRLINTAVVWLSVPNGGYRTPTLPRPSQCVTVIVVTGQSLMPRLS